MKENEPQRKRRRPWLAALLSLASPGVGQLYCGNAKRWLAFSAAMVVLAIGPILLFRATNDFRFVLIWVAGGAVVGVFGVVDAWRLAAKSPGIVLKPYNRWYVYAFGIVAMAVAMKLIPTFNDVQIRNFYNASASMEPSMLKGERWTARMNGKGHAVPERGRIIVFEDPRKPGIDYVKRLVALPGETVQLIGGCLYINGKEMKREAIRQVDASSNEYRETLPNGYSYDIYELRGTFPAENTAPLVVPAGSVYVLGDNRDRSEDSRYPMFGPVPIDKIKGVAEFVFWSTDKFRIGMRFESLGG